MILPFRGGDPPQVGEGHTRVIQSVRENGAPTERRCCLHRLDYLRVPLHQLRWSPSPQGED